ncbi:ABC transporter permease [Limnohabitans sp.]|uniref:ABC transporter permease n=1 Tax=Limnohabitans sp. TaxID=1907725 RepID=UPI002AFEB51B|nr:ABC transporter permease [Limnohabitans sp.]
MQSNHWATYLWPWQFRDLIWQFARREVVARYRGSWLGMGWSVITPLAMLLIYTLVFKHVFNARWPSAAEGSNFDFALNLYAGLIIFNWAVELLARAPRLILDQPNLVTKVVFPLPVLAWAALLAASFQTLISTLLWLLACILGGHSPGVLWVLVPIILLSFAPWLLGMSWLLSGLGVYLRDLSQLVSLAMSGLMFLSPIFYPTQALPAWLRPVVQWNPLTGPIEAMRDCVLNNTFPQVWLLAISTGLGLLTCVLGLSLLERIKSGFADVL